MKIKWINLIIGGGLVALGTYGLFLLNVNEVYKLLCITFAIQFFVSLTLLISVSFEDRALKYNLNPVCIVFLILFITIAVIFARINPFKQNIFIITEGIVSLLFLLVINSSVQTLKKINKQKSKTCYEMSIN